MKYVPQIVIDHYADHGIALEAEHEFHDTRGWLFDFIVTGVDPYIKIALEAEGLNGRHQRTAGFIEDCLKYSSAAARGWLIIRSTVADLCMDTTVELVQSAIANRQRELEEVRNGKT